MVVLGRCHQERVGSGHRRLQADDRRGLAGILDILVVERDLVQIEYLDDDPARGKLAGGSDQSAVVRRPPETAGKAQDPDLIHVRDILSWAVTRLELALPWLEQRRDELAWLA